MLEELLQQIQQAESKADQVLQKANVEAEAMQQLTDIELTAKRTAFLHEQHIKATQAIALAETQAKNSGDKTKSDSNTKIDAINKSAKANKQKAVNLILKHIGV